MKIQITKKEANILSGVCFNNAGIGGTTEFNSEEWNNLGNKILNKEALK